MSFLCRTDAEIINDIDIIVADFVGFYRNFFGIKVPRKPTDWPVFREGYTLQEQEQLTLISYVMDIEIKQIIYYIGNEKTPVPNDYTAFLKEKRGLVRWDVIDAVKEFFSTVLILKKLNHTHIPLIPKKSHNPIVSDFHHIACTNVIY